MPTVTIHGEKAVEVEAGKKLVLAIEDAGIDILHRCGGDARCTTCRVEVLDGSVPPMGEVEKERLRARRGPGAEYPALLPDPRRVGRGGPGHQPVAAGRDSPRTAPGRLRGSTPATAPPTVRLPLICASDVRSSACNARTGGAAWAPHHEHRWNFA